MFEAFAQGGAGDAEKLGRAQLVVPGGLHGAAGEFLLEPREQFESGLRGGRCEKEAGGLVEIGRCGEGNRSFAGLRGGGLSQRKVFGQEDVAGREDGGPLEIGRASCRERV